MFFLTNGLLTPERGFFAPIVPAHSTDGGYLTQNKAKLAVRALMFNFTLISSTILVTTILTPPSLSMYASANWQDSSPKTLFVSSADVSVPTLAAASVQRMCVGENYWICSLWKLIFCALQVFRLDISIYICPSTSLVIMIVVVWTFAKVVRFAALPALCK